VAVNYERKVHVSRELSPNRERPVALILCISISGKNLIYIQDHFSYPQPMGRQALGIKQRDPIMSGDIFRNAARSEQGGRMKRTVVSFSRLRVNPAQS
jgi:hypothetical protein